MAQRPTRSCGRWPAPASLRRSRARKARSAGRRTTAPAGCSSSRSSSARRRRRCSTRTRTRRRSRLLIADGSTPPAIFDRMAERYDELRGREEQLAEQFEFTVAEGLGAATRLLDVGCGTGSLIASGGRAPGRQGVGRRRLRADAREGPRAARARRGVQARAGRRPAVPQGLVRRGHDAPRRAHARRAPAERAGRGAPRARARGSPLHLDVRARALHGPSPAPVPARPSRRSTSRASRTPSC